MSNLFKTEDAHMVIIMWNAMTDAQRFEHMTDNSQFYKTMQAAHRLVDVEDALNELLTATVH